MGRMLIDIFYSLTDLVGVGKAFDEVAELIKLI